MIQPFHSFAYLASLIQVGNYEELLLFAHDAYIELVGVS